MIPTFIEQFVLASRPNGLPTLEHFRFERVPAPPLRDGEVFLRTLYLSLDPYMRSRMADRKSYAPPVSVGEPMEGESVAEVIASRSPGLREGDRVLARTGWRSHAVLNGAGLRVIDLGLGPLTAWLGVLGMPGFTAYAGLAAIGRPRRGETVVVAAASGPVGSLVGQLARQSGCRTVGIAGGGPKCAYVTQTLKFDAAIDHRSADFAAELAAACPAGIDVYFENVGGAIWQAVMPLLNAKARVPVCGIIAQYNDEPDAFTYRLAPTMREVLSKRILLQGFINSDFLDEHHEAFLRTVSAGVASGAIVYREDVTDGLRNAPAAFIAMLGGGNFGKALVKVAE